MYMLCRGRHSDLTFIFSDVPSSDPGDEEIEVPEPTKDENGKGRVSFDEISFNSSFIFLTSWTVFVIVEIVYSSMLNLQFFTNHSSG